MKPSPMLPNRLKTCPQGDFDMLKWNLTSKTFDSATQTSKIRKTTSNVFPHRQCGGCKIFLRLPLLHSSSAPSPLLPPLSTHAVQLTLPIGDDGQRCPGLPIFSFACGALFSVLRLHSSFPFIRLFRSSCVPVLCSSDFFSTPQELPIPEQMLHS